ncbi:MAG: RsiV family protein [Lachnospiraceae bacterium]
MNDDRKVTQDQDQPNGQKNTEENIQLENRRKVFANMKQSYNQQTMPKEAVDRMRTGIQEAKLVNRAQSRKKAAGMGFGLAAALAVVLLVLPNTSPSIAYAMSKVPVLGKVVEVATVREYKYEDDKSEADIEVPEIAVSSAAPDKELSDAEAEDQNGETTEQLEATVKDINEQISLIADRIVAEFKASTKDDVGYQNVIVKSEVIESTEDYFTLKLICYQGAGSGAEWDYYYTIDLSTGKQMKLGELFQEDSDYLGLISENIKTQMRQQMEEDPNKIYWIDDEEFPQMNFDKISENVNFYLNKDGNLVICFDEGEAAPMYMGCLEFEIPKEVTRDIRK